MTDIVERLIAYRPTNDWGDGVHHTICTEAAGEIESLRSRAEKAEAERDELHSWTKTITTAISDAVGLGSEMFRRHGEQYRIDPAFVAGYIRDRREDHHNSMYRNIRRIRELQATCEKLAEALEKIAALTARCEHDGGFDREIGPIGCNLGDKCVCIGIHPIASDAISKEASDAD